MIKQNSNFLEKLYRHPWLIVFATALITVFFAFQLPKAELDNNNIRFVPEDDEARLTSKYIDDTFGSSLFILVALERKYGDVFDAAFLNRIREFNEKMEEFEIVGEVNSLVSSDYIFAEGDAVEHSSIVVQKLVGRDFAGSPAETASEVSALKQRLLSWDIYRRSLISDDFRATQILVPLDISEEQASLPEIEDKFIEIRDIAREMFAPYADVYVTGLPMISATINEAMRADLVLMIPLVILVVLLVLFFSFRRFTPVILPLITVLVATVWSMGAMPLFGIKLSVVSTVLPVILVAVGSAYGIHVVTHYLEGMKAAAVVTANAAAVATASATANAEMSREEHFVFVLALVRKIGKAVFLAALTTLAGFSAFCFTSVLPIREFGIFSTLGVLVSFLVAVTLIPSLLIIRGPRRINNPAASSAVVDGGEPLPEAPSEPVPEAPPYVAVFFAHIARKREMVVFAASLILLISIWGVTKVVLDNIFVEYFKPSTDIYRSDRFIREKFGGSKVVSVVAQADTTERLLMPDVLVAMDGLGAYLESHVGEVGKVMGFTDLVKRINQVFNADESPQGLQPGLRPSLQPTGTPFGFGDDGFGFGAFGENDFGFADFGFGDWDANGAADGTAAAPAQAPLPTGKEREPVSAAELVGLLREAAASGESRYLDVNGLVREMEKLVNYEGAAYYEIPKDPLRYGKTHPEELSQLVANYLILLSGNIDSYANDPLSPTAIKTTVQLRTLGDKDTGRAINSIRAYIAGNFPGDIETIIGGSALVEGSLNRLVVQSQLSSVVISVLIVFLIVALSNRSLAAGLVGIVPLSICILINFAVMGFAGIKLNIGTSMVAAVSVGIGIDYTIHYMEAYKREYRAAGGKAGFLLKTFASSGKAILINAASVGTGFAVLMFSQFIMLRHLGFLIALSMASSALASLTVIPVLLLTFKPRFVYGEGGQR